MNSLEPNVHLDEYLDLQKYWLVMKRRWLPAVVTFAGIVGLSVVYSLSLTPVYEGEAKLLIRRDRSSSLTGLENETSRIDVTSRNSDPLATEAEIISSRPIVEKLIRELDLRDDDGDSLKYANLIRGLNVKTVTGTDVLEVTFVDEDPEFVATVVNKLVQVYQEQDTLSNRTEASAAREFISEQLPQVEANVKEAEARLREFKNKYRITNLEQETNATISNLSGLNIQIDTLRGELEDVDARYNRLRSQLKISWQEASAMEALSQSIAVQTIFERLQQVKLELAQRRNYLADNAPQIVSLQGEIVELQQDLNGEIRQTLGREQQATLGNVNILALGNLNQGQVSELAQLGLEREGLQQKLSALNSIYSNNKRKSDILPQLDEEQTELERQVDAAQSTYTVLLNKLQETRIAEEQDIGKVRVVSAAVVPDEPMGPSKKKIVAGGSILGALLGVVIAFLLDIRDKTVKNTKEAEEMLAYPLHGTIPEYKLLSSDKNFKNSSSLAPLGSEMSIPYLREAYQNIQVSLRFFGIQEGIRTLAITSSVSGEGKTSVSANYATAVAQSGKRVLLIDCDLRCPSQHKRWKISNKSGLSNVLQEQFSWQDTVQNVMPNLDILTSGTIPENPVTLLNSLSMNILIMNLLEHYDQVIFDTPPLVGLADSKIIGKLVDGLLFVVRPGVASYGAITAAKKILEAKDLNVLGIVTNGVSWSQEPLGYESYNVDKKYLSSK